jgi:hypothetical protein
MPLRECQPFEPELIEAMRLAFRKTCETLRLTDKDDVFTEIVAEKIVELAKTGESDPEQLCSQVLRVLPEQRKAS